jgi:hypothetical protein
MMAISLLHFGFLAGLSQDDVVLLIGSQGATAVCWR